MPIYLCLPGHSSKEKWRHGMRIYDRPHSLSDDGASVEGGASAGGAGGGGSDAGARERQRRKMDHAIRSFSDSSVEGGETPTHAGRSAERDRGGGSAGAASGSGGTKARKATSVRRARHAEVLLADRAITSHGRIWVRLRWPGELGGFGGFVAMDSGGSSDEGSGERMICRETSVNYPSSKGMKLLEGYDDGIGERMEGDEGEGEPVFCRICREGLHDVNYDLETTTDAAKSNDALSDNEMPRDTEPSFNNAPHDNPPTPASSPTASFALPPLILHHPTAENPLLSPCACTGSMAFVHYLCIEQWRCRSRHPSAKNGLNCETCGTPYTLPPPPSRPNVMGEVMEEDWMDAMPPHVLAALRRPHPWWQIGAAAVRRRWLRPFVPIVISPLVALYCRARRTLKKRGVSRRRWACSLCRRRARWKCVRCLRSYYCSRQCQNVSWHIVHKHVCYKPGRFWWSVVVYSVGTLVAVPGILKDLLLYDLMFTLLPINFIVMGVIAGGFASVIKQYQGSDIRGRMLELAVVFFTIWLTMLSSGLVRAYFGDISQCTGFVPPLGSLPVGPFAPLLAVLKYFLHMWHPWYKKWDYAFAKLGIISNRVLCAPGPDGSTDYSTIGCSPSIRNINPEFYLGDEGQPCRADMVLVVGFWMTALSFLGIGSIYRHWRRRRGAADRGRGRLHQD